MTKARLNTWLDRHSGKGIHWYLKRLSGNDTLANGSHQAGPYIPRRLLLTLLPVLNRPTTLNPDVQLNLRIDSHRDYRQVRAVWYNNKFHSGTRNETRVTGLGGQSSPLLDPDNTGALVLFSFPEPAPNEEPECHIWVSRNYAEDSLIEDRTGPVEPGRGNVWIPHPDTDSELDATPPGRPCWLERSQIPKEWLEKYPSGEEFAWKSLELQEYRSLPPDKRIVKRRECEYELFRSVEEAVELPKIEQGFADMRSFLALAQSILQRRKARSGISLEIHARAIFREEGLVEDQHFAYQAVTPRGRRPDFVFPSVDAYLNPSFPKSQLRMLAVKTTCRDRWRQILNEADRDIQWTNLLTVQEGVSEAQYREMVESKVKLVVPEPLKKCFPPSIRPELQTLGEFIDEVKRLRGSKA